MWRRQLPRAIAFGSMLAGLTLAVWGRSVEADSFRASPSVFEGGPPDEVFTRERDRAYGLKAAGVSGPERAGGLAGGRDAAADAKPAINQAL